MKKISEDSINFFSATLIGGVSVGEQADPDFALEQLFLTEGGRYVLYAEGGPCTQYAIRSENISSVFGTHTFELSPDEAMEWGRKYLDHDDYALFFGSYPDNERKAEDR